MSSPRQSYSEYERKWLRINFANNQPQHILAEAFSAAFKGKKISQATVSQSLGDEWAYLDQYKLEEVSKTKFRRSRDTSKKKHKSSDHGERLSQGERHHRDDRHSAKTQEPAPDTAYAMAPEYGQPSTSAWDTGGYSSTSSMLSTPSWSYAPPGVAGYDADPTATMYSTTTYTSPYTSQPLALSSASHHAGSDWSTTATYDPYGYVNMPSTAYPGAFPAPYDSGTVYPSRYRLSIVMSTGRRILVLLNQDMASSHRASCAAVSIAAVGIAAVARAAEDTRPSRIKVPLRPTSRTLVPDHSMAHHAGLQDVHPA